MYNAMMNKVAQVYGMEDDRTVEFFTLCEIAGYDEDSWKAVRELFDGIMKDDIFTE